MVALIIIGIMAIIVVVGVYHLGFHDGVIKGLDDALKEIERSKNVQSNTERK
jgi:uncharacterized membrane protein